MAKHLQRVEFFLYPGALGLDIIGPLDVFTIATECLNRDYPGGRGYDVVFSGRTPGPVRLNSGLDLLAQIEVGQGPPPDILIIPGGKGAELTARDAALCDRIRAHALKAASVVSICTGAFILAACGLLSGRRAATHWAETDRLAALYPDIRVCRDRLFVRDGNILTSAGVTAGIDLALSMVEADHGSALAMQVARLLVLYLRRPGRQSQFSEPLKLRARAAGQFTQVHDWILSHLDLPLTVEDLSEVAGMSPRNFSRVFAQKTGIAPGRYVELMRLNRAREILETSDAPVKEVAKASGFGREERLRRAFDRHLGVGPTAYRIHFRHR